MGGKPSAPSAIDLHAPLDSAYNTAGNAAYSGTSTAFETLHAANDRVSTPLATTDVLSNINNTIDEMTGTIYDTNIQIHEGIQTIEGIEHTIGHATSWMR